MENTVASLLNRLHDRYRACHEGAVADYIPELTKADPEWFGISIFTTDGCGYAVGDAEQPFTIQSIRNTALAFVWPFLVLDAWHEYGLVALAAGYLLFAYGLKEKLTEWLFDGEDNKQP